MPRSIAYLCASLALAITVAARPPHSDAAPEVGGEPTATPAGRHVPAGQGPGTGPTGRVGAGRGSQEARDSQSAPAAAPAPGDLPASATEPGTDGDREAGPDPAAALTQTPLSPSTHEPEAAPTASGLDWGLGSTPEQQEVDIERLPDVPMERLDPAFPVPGQLRTRVDFWKYIYSGVGMYELVIHDTRHMDKVYEIVAMPARPRDWRTYLKMRKATLQRARAKYRSILARLATAGPRTNLTAEEARVQALLADLPGGPARYREAARRIHGQAGMRDRFLEALDASKDYLPEMERVFRERNLPIELTRLPFVESGFNPHASSKSRAVGVWQFIKSTGRRFDLVTRQRDLRRDVTASTTAAAKLLSHNYRQTGSWPLALMAYHHGLAGIKRAARVTGTSDVDVIVRTYNGRRFKYASRNYYAQFVAVNELHALVRHARARDLPAEEALAGITRPAAATRPVSADRPEAAIRRPD
jgi:soluble lytic murein transglycosylase-like protein